MARIPLLVIIGFFYGITGFAQQTAPSIEEVAGQFYNTYDPALQGLYVNFEKRASQWKVNTRTYEDGKWVSGKAYLYFDRDSGGYQKLPLTPQSNNQPVDFRKYVDDYTIAGFHLHQYYGYEGWYKDVIAALSGRKTLSDSSLYSLARAYSAYASGLLSDQAADAIKAEMFYMPMTRNCMSRTQREKYSGIERQAIRCFYALNRQNKNFETVVGKIAMKCANEVVTEFHSYLTYADTFAASFPLPANLYPDSVIGRARRVLEKCPRNAILLSLGDNDFYPVLYVQHKMGVRKDVYVINQSLIGLDRFIYQLSQPQFEAPPIRVSVQYPQYMGNVNDYLMLGDGDSAIAFNRVMDTIRSGRRNDYGVLTLPGKEFVLQHISHQDSSHSYNGAPVNIRMVADVHLKWPSPYLLKNDWVLLDILNNLEGRNLCCQTPLYDAWEQLNSHLERVDEHLYVY